MQCSKWSLPSIEAKSADQLFVDEKDKQQADKDALVNLQKQAEANGFKQGEKAGYDAGFKEFGENIANFATLMNNLALETKQLSVDLHQHIVQLVVKISESLIRHELTTNPGIIEHLVETALESLPICSEKIEIILHPKDVEIIRERLPVEPQFELVAEESMTRGGCIIKSGMTEIDATIETRLQEVLEKIHEQPET